MKKVKLAVLAFSAVSSVPVLAQNLILYGVLDTGMEYITNANASGASLTRMPVIGGGDLPSRWGMKGAEDLGGGLKAVVSLESGFSLADGSLQQGGRFFGRELYVGLSGPWGRVSLGRQYSMTIAAMAESNVLGAGGFGGLGSLDPYLLAARVDNSITYLGSFSGLTIGAAYSLGRDGISCAGGVGGDAMACRAGSAMVKYATQSWGVAASYDELRGGPGTGTMTIVPGLKGINFTKSSDSDRRYQLAAYLNVGSVRYGAGWLHRNLQGDTQNIQTNIVYLGASIPYNQWTFDAQLSRINNGNLSASGLMSAIRVNYSFSKRTALYGVLAHMSNSGSNSIYSVSAASAIPAAPAPGVSQSGVEFGIRHSF